MERNAAELVAETNAWPEQIGPYRIVTLLGEGGTGTVYHAIHVVSQEAVALKTVRLPHETYLETLRREIQALSQLHHPGIVRILDHGLWEGAPWYAMEFIVGENLRHYARQRLAPAHTQVDPTLPNDEHNDEHNDEDKRDKDDRHHEYDRLDDDDDDDDDDTSIDMHSAASQTVEALEALAEIDLWEDDETEINPKAWWTESLATPTSLKAWSGVDLDQMDAAESSHTTSQATTTHQTLEDLTPEEVRVHYVLTLMRHLCDPLAYLHGEGLVHRDLKPENIVIKPDGKPILIDFGLLTRFRAGVGREHLDGRVMRGGTASYMAPEQFLGESVDARADIYALGCIFYELLVGQPPFVGNEQEIAAQHLFGQPIPPSMRTKGATPAIDALIQRMLARKPTERTGYARAVDAQLAQWGAAPPDATGIPSRHYLYPSQMHGRSKELAALQALAADVTHRTRGHLISLHGAPGIGKTRLAIEFVRQLPPKQLRVLSATCLEQQDIPLEAFRPLLICLADQIQQQGPQERQRLLGTHGRILSLYDESLYQAMGGGQSASFASLPPAQARPILLQSLLDALRTLSQEQPILYIIDDLHRADELTQAALHQLLKEGIPPGVMMLCLWPTDQPCCLNHTTQPSLTTLALPPLTQADIAAVIADLLATQEAPQAFVQALYQLSKGNPFVASTSMHEAIAEGSFVQDTWGQWHFPSDKAPPLQATDTTTNTHIEHEDEDEDEDEDETSPQQGQLQANASAAARWEIQSLVESARLCAKQGKLNDAKTMLQEALAAWSAQTNPIEQAKVKGYLGDMELECGEVEAAKAHYQEALQLLQETDSQEQILRLIQSHMAQLLSIQGHHAQATELSQRALQQHRDAQDTHLEALTLTNLGMIQWLDDKPEEARHLLEAALLLHRDNNQRSGEADVLGYLSLTLYAQGNNELAYEHIMAAVKIAQELQYPRQEGLFRIYLHRMLRRGGGQHNELRAQLDLIQQLLEGPGTHPYLALAYCEHGHFLLACGNSAEDLLQQATQLATHLHIQLDSRAEITLAINRLKRAQRAHLHKQPMLFGETPYDYPKQRRQYPKTIELETLK